MDYYERGAVIESVIARPHRWVESSQRQVTLVGLSATLLNYEDVVEKGRGLFHFGPEIERDKTMDEFCYEVVAEHYVVGINGGICAFTQGNGNTAEALAERAAMEGEIEHLFIEEGLNEARTKYIDRAEKSQNTRKWNGNTSCGHAAS